MTITLKAARVNAGFTQSDVAKIMKVSKQTIVNWEAGKVTIDVASFDFLCRLYKVHKNNIFLPNQSTLS